MIARTAAAVGGSPYPPMTVEAEHYPREWSPIACSRYRNEIIEIHNEGGLDAQQSLASLGAAVAMLIMQTKDVLPVKISAVLALEMMVGVSRTAPIAKEDMHKYG